MITHQVEEGLLRDVRNVSHRDRGLAVMLPAATVWLVGGALIVAGGFGDGFGAAAAMMLAGFVLVLGLAAGMAGGRVASRAAARKRDAEAAARQAEQIVLSRRRVEEARRRGDFDRWEKPGSSGPVA